jgi:hypothetical protein
MGTAEENESLEEPSGLTPAEAAEMTRIDTNGDGVISAKEARAAARSGASLRASNMLMGRLLILCVVLLVISWAGNGALTAAVVYLSKDLKVDSIDGSLRATRDGASIRTHYAKTKLKADEIEIGEEDRRRLTEGDTIGIPVAEISCEHVRQGIALMQAGENEAVVEIPHGDNRMYTTSVSANYYDLENGSDFGITGIKVEEDRDLLYDVTCDRAQCNEDAGYKCQILASAMSSHGVHRLLGHCPVSSQKVCGTPTCDYVCLYRFCVIGKWDACVQVDGYTGSLQMADLGAGYGRRLSHRSGVSTTVCRSIGSEYAATGVGTVYRGRDCTARIGSSNLIQPSWAPSPLTRSPRCCTQDPNVIVKPPPTFLEDAEYTLKKKASCHPTGSYLTLEDGKSIAVEHAAVGTLVKTETGFQPILGFLHAEEDLMAPYLRFTTTSASMAISPLHHAFVNGAEIDPSFIKLGDLLHTPHGLEPVTRIETITARGAYHFIVKGGSYFVDGILASDYDAAVSRAVWPLVHAYVGARYWLGIPVIPSGKGLFPRHDWMSIMFVRAGVPLWAQQNVLTPLIVASSILTELTNVAVEHFPAWLGTVAAATAVAKVGRKSRP